MDNENLSRAYQNNNSYDEMITSLEKNQVIFDFVREINELKKRGHKSFGIMSIGYPELQHRVLIASSGLLHKYNLRDKLGIAVSSRSLLLQNFIKRSIKKKQKVNSSHITSHDFHHRFDVTFLDEITNNYDSSKEIEYTELVRSFSEIYDTILWDLPLIGEIKSNYEQYIPILEDISNVFLVLSAKGSTKDEIEKIKEYFANFNIKISGIILNTSEKKSAKWWEFWK